VGSTDPTACKTILSITTYDQFPAISAEKDDYQPLVDRCLAGDDIAYTLLYRACASQIYRLCYSLLNNAEDAEEVLQDSFEYAFRRLHTFDASKSAFRTWLYRIAISRTRNKRRRKWLPTFSLNQMVDDDITDHDTPDPLAITQLTEEQQQIWTAVQTLSPKLREVAVLRYYDGLKYREIGEILGIGGKSAESRMRLAHKQLKELLS
jgi:RNA polymerase sigma-70 factor (ECF subfamily)